MTDIDVLSAALCAWKEARSGGIDSMRAVINVLLNRAKESGASLYEEVYRPLQFSSMSYPHDPQLLKQPTPNDAFDWQQWINARSLANSASTGVFEDNTGGATSYYALSMPAPPAWGAKMIKTVVIGGQQFLKKAN